MLSLRRCTSFYPLARALMTKSESLIVSFLPFHKLDKRIDL